MTDDQLRQLVEDADFAVGRSHPRLPRADDLLAALALRRRRRTRRRGVAACVACVVALASWHAVNIREGAAPWVVAQNSRAPSLDVTAVRARLKQLDREAALRLRVIDGLADAESITDSGITTSVQVGAGEEQFSQEVARSAALSWRYATLVEQEFGDAAAARRQYERVVARFPDTPWAQQAAESLRRLPLPDDSQHL